MYPFQTLKDVASFEGKTILLRSELNAPLAHGVVSDSSRLDASLGTIKLLLGRGAKLVIIAHASSIDKNERLSLEPAYQYLKKHIPVTFVREYARGEAHGVVDTLKSGEAVLFENLRFDEREESNDKTFAETLASYGDIYVNDAFPVSHRSHASIVGIPEFLPSYAGLQFEEEYYALSKALNPEHPFLFILGGAKFNTKLPLARVFLDKADYVFLGGALLNPVLKAKGFSIGKSLVAEGNKEDIEAIAQHDHLFLATDVICVQSGEAKECSVDSIGDDGFISDIGPESIEMLKEKIREAKFILWNGPLGDFEHGFRTATDEVAEAIRESSAESVVGGGDSLASLGDTRGFTFVSTAGGAMLEFLSKGTLVGVEALTQ